MPRRREVPKREILPDPKYGNVDVAKFVNVLMLSGKKSVAENVLKWRTGGLNIDGCRVGSNIIQQKQKLRITHQ